MKLIKDKGNVIKAMKQEQGDSLKEFNSALIKFQDWNEFGKSPYVGVTSFWHRSGSHYDRGQEVSIDMDI